MSVNIEYRRRGRMPPGLVPLRQMQEARRAANENMFDDQSEPLNESGPDNEALLADATTATTNNSRAVAFRCDEHPNNLTLESLVTESKLMEAWQCLSQKGQAAGPDGVTYQDLGRNERFEVFRWLIRVVRDRIYRPSQPREVLIPKGSGKFRSLSLRNVCDRLLARTVLDAIAPIIDAALLPSCLGFRPGKGIYQVLAQVCRTVELTSNTVMLEADVANAFPSLPIDGILHAYGQHIHDEGLLWLIRTIIRGYSGVAKCRSIEQGCPLSPLSLNIFMHYLYDLPLHAAGLQESPLRQFRYVDNLIYVCPSVSDGTQRLAEASRLLSPAGLTLKPDHTLIDLRRPGARTDILGFQVRLVNNRLQIGMGKKAYAGLRESLAAACLSPAPPEAARMAVEGWLGATGPAVESVRENEVIRQAQDLAARYGYRAVGTTADLRGRLQGAYQKWVALREQVLRG